jgi:hypothetical protein
MICILEPSPKKGRVTEGYMALELAHRFSEHAHFIIPPSSCEFQYSGRPYYERRPSKKIERFKKHNPDMFFYMEADGIDASIYREE